MNEHGFCRLLLAEVMRDVRAVYRPEEVASAWAWGSGGTRAGSSYEFHGPHDEYVTCSRADCRWSAAYEGWSSLLHPYVDPLEVPDETV
jgi:hypothetical protein